MLAAVLAQTGEAAIESAQRNHPDLILLDVMMPGLDGFETCQRLKADSSTRDIPVIFVSARDETRSVLQGFDVGGVDYVSKPLQTKELLTRVKTHLRIHRLTQELRRKNEALQAEINQRKRAEEQVSVLARREADPWSLSGLIGECAVFRETLANVEKVRRFRSTNVVIVGESGTGKELIARAIHYTEPLPKGAFVPVNCSAIPRELAESSFFGHVKGAFSGASSEHKGYFVQAHEGTLFLDEIGDMPLELQARLLRGLEDGKVVPVGGVKAQQVTLRVLAGTNVDLQADIEKGRFRQDLYFRLAGFTIEVPPLRDRQKDIPLLADYFLQRFSGEMGMRPPPLTRAALAALERYDYPGHVRELKNVIERALIESGGAAITPRHLHFVHALGDHRFPGRARSPGEDLASGDPTDEQRILQHVDQHGSINNTECRDLLSVGLHRACYLLRKLHRAGLIQRQQSRRSAHYVKAGSHRER